MDNEILILRNKKNSIDEIAKIVNCSRSKVYRLCIQHNLGKIQIDRKRTSFKHSDETKRKMSESKRKLYKNNPEKHNWKSPTKFNSNPCNNFKKILDNINVKYVPEYNPLINRFFSIDIAFPDKKIGIEINGNQHYNIDGSLKEYYQERHNLIESDGWKLYEIHFSICYNEDVIIKTINEILNNSHMIFEFDYDLYLKNKLSNKAKFDNCLCGNKKQRVSKSCKRCVGLKQKRKVHNRPTIDILNNDIKSYGYKATGKKYGVSDNTIRKWIKLYENHPLNDETICPDSQSRTDMEPFNLSTPYESEDIYPVNF